MRLIKRIANNKIVQAYGRIMAVGLVIVVIGAVVSINHYRSLSAQSVSNVSNQSNTPVNNDQDNSVSTTLTPATTTPTPTPQATTSTPAAPSVVDNSAKCSSIIAQAKSDLTNLNTQIVAQLQIEKAIIGNSSIDSEILSHGGSVTQTVGQAGITESFNQASTTANSLIGQFETDSSNYQDQLIGLDNGTSPGCAVMILPLH